MLEVGFDWDPFMHNVVAICFLNHTLDDYAGSR